MTHWFSGFVIPANAVIQMKARHQPGRLFTANGMVDMQCNNGRACEDKISIKRSVCFASIPKELHLCAVPVHFGHVPKNSNRCSSTLNPNLSLINASKFFRSHPVGSKASI